MRTDPPNPYLDLDLGGLRDAMARRATDLLAGRLVGRRDTAYLLICACARYGPDAAHPNSPHRVVRERIEPAQVAFWRVYTMRVEGERHWALTQAVDAAGLPATWVNQWRRGVPMGSDDVLREALAAVDRERPDTVHSLSSAAT